MTDPRRDPVAARAAALGRWGERSLIERWLDKIVLDRSGCWLWTGATDGHGYGQINVGGRPVKAYRLAYELLVGPIPAGFHIDHLCRVRLCVNAAHLEPVTVDENNRRSREAVGHHNALKAHCPRGHPYDERNTRIGRTACGGVGRWCRPCHIEANRRYLQRKAGIA